MDQKLADLSLIGMKLLKGLDNIRILFFILLSLCHNIPVTAVFLAVRPLSAPHKIQEKPKYRKEKDNNDPEGLVGLSVIHKHKYKKNAKDL